MGSHITGLVKYLMRSLIGEVLFLVDLYSLFYGLYHIGGFCIATIEHARTNDVCGRTSLDSTQTISVDEGKPYLRPDETTNPMKI